MQIRMRTKLGFILLVLGIMMLVSTKAEVEMANQAPVDIYDENITSIHKGMSVKTELVEVFDYCAYEEVSHRINFIEVSKSVDKHYAIIPVFLGDDTKFICAEINENDKATCDLLIDEMWDYIDGKSSTYGSTSIPYEGGIVEMDSEIYGYMLDWFVEAGFDVSRQAVKSYALPYMLTRFDHESVKTSVYWFVAMVVAGVGLLVWSFFSREYSFEGRSMQNTTAATATSSPVTGNGAPGKDPKRNLVRKTIDINGVEYPIEQFAQADAYMQQGIKGRAMEIIRDTAGITLAEAKAIADAWDEYYF